MRKIIILLLGVVLVTAACKKIQEGFLSDTMRYIDKNIYCLRGLPLVQTQRIDIDGSTPPMNFEMLNLRDENGKPAPKEFFEKYEVLLFKPGMAFDIKTDTTVAELDKKREKKTIPPMDFNPISGQISFNRGSVNIPLGKYTFDLQATNVHGTKIFPAFATINIVDPVADDIFVQEDNVSNAFHNVTGAATPHKNPKLTFTKVSNDGARIILKLTDKNGNPFNPKAGEIIRRGDRPTFENYAKFTPVKFTDTAMVCDFEVAPFPLAKYVDATTDWGHLIYYRIPSQFATVDGFTPGLYSVNPRFAFTLKMEGTYIIELKFTDVTRVN
ncbi:DUF5007 domain-containing protein [Paraflavitalea soli]|uniref:DUF5007 domain-containing protein n=1 Tax=Paraflavitalea soli TaxID=2315862 RepID=A0A3B7MS20_9BACT|nr:DUF5007 domain-containing protein [Paraflavitalea soli]AXY74415.1 DUF5007 domain-containing protein [Paraflavitalea soli]